MLLAGLLHFIGWLSLLTWHAFPLNTGTSRRIWPGNCSCCVGKIHLLENGNRGTSFMHHTPVILSATSMIFVPDNISSIWLWLPIWLLKPMVICSYNFSTSQLSCSVMCIFLCWSESQSHPDTCIDLKCHLHQTFITAVMTI